MSEKNPKFRIVNPAQTTPAQRTFIVVGLGRSGTSFAASVLDYLGVFMGDEATPRTLEDRRLGQPLDARDDAALQQVIADYDARHDVWGFKRPSMLLHTGRTAPMFRNPHYIFTHRDFFSIALRNEIAIARDITESLRKCVDASARIYDFMEQATQPCLHLSFELMNADRIRAAEVIRDFVFPDQAGQAISEKAFGEFMDRRLDTYLNAPAPAKKD